MFLLFYAVSFKTLREKKRYYRKKEEMELIFKSKWNRRLQNIKVKEKYRSQTKIYIFTNQIGFLFAM